MVQGKLVSHSHTVKPTLKKRVVSGKKKPTIKKVTEAERKEAMKILTTAEKKPKPVTKEPAKKKVSKKKPTIKKVTEAERKEAMKILTTAERAALPSKAERARKAAEAKAAIEQREFEKKIEAQTARARKLDIQLGRLEPTRGPVAPTPLAPPPSLFQIKRGQAGPAISQAASTRYQQQALSHIYTQAQQQGFERAKDIQLTGLSKTAFDYTKKIAAGTGEFARITRKGAPILQEKIGVVSPTTGKIIRYPIESVVRGIEMAGMLPGGVAVMAASPEVIVPALVVGAREVFVGMPTAAITDPKQFISDIVTLGIVFKGVPAAKAAVKFKPTVPKLKIPELKPTALQKQYLELAAIWEAPKVKAPIEVVKITPKNVIKNKVIKIEKVDTIVQSKGNKIAKDIISKEKKDLTPKQEKLVNDKIEGMREDAYIQIKKRWKQEDALYKQINKEMKSLDRQGQKVPEWMKETQFDLKMSIGKGGRSRVRANAEINKIVNDALFRESLEIRTIIKKGASKTERQSFIKKRKHKIEVETKKKTPSPTQIKLWERQIEIARTTKNVTIDEIIAQSKSKGRVRGFKELFAEEKAEARLIPELRPPSQRSIQATFRQVHPDTLTKNLKTYYRNVPAFRSAKYQRIVTGKWNKTIDKWNSRFVPEMVSSKSLTKVQSRTLSKSIMNVLFKHKATTMIGVLRMFPAATVSIYQSLTQMQKQTVQEMIFEMLDTQAKLIGEITKAPPKPKEVKPVPPRVGKARPPPKVKPIPEKPRPPKPRPAKAIEEMPLPKILPQMRAVKKKKVVKVVRKVRKEYTNYQIINQIGGIAQLFG